MLLYYQEAQLTLIVSNSYRIKGIDIASLQTVYTRFQVLIVVLLFLDLRYRFVSLTGFRFLNDLYAFNLTLYLIYVESEMPNHQ